MFKEATVIKAEAAVDLPPPPKKQRPRPKYLSSRKLGILEAERRGLIAFVEAPIRGDELEFPNGQRHWYEQDSWGQLMTRPFCGHSCRSMGCVAGWVFSYHRLLHPGTKLRGCSTMLSYGNSYKQQYYSEKRDSLAELYYHAGPFVTPAWAKRVVRRFLQTGKVRWPTYSTLYLRW